MSPEFVDKDDNNSKIVTKISWISYTGQKIVSGDILPDSHLLQTGSLQLITDLSLPD
jgi:hypothetical protein